MHSRIDKTKITCTCIINTVHAVVSFFCETLDKRNNRPCFSVQKSLQDHTTYSYGLTTLEVQIHVLIFKKYDEQKKIIRLINCVFKITQVILILFS